MDAMSVGDQETAIHSFSVGLDNGKYDYENVKGFNLNFTLELHDTIHGNDKLATIANQQGYICGYGPPLNQTEKQQLPKQEETKCLGPQNQVTKTSFSMPQDSIMQVSYIPAQLNEYQNRHIITVQDTGPLVYNKNPWKFTYEVVDHEGLVIKDITAGGQSIFKSLSVPHFKIESLKGASQIVRFNKDCDDWFTPAAKKLDSERDAITWGFTKKIEEPNLTGTLSISYEIVVWTSHKNNCEKGAGFNCYRFVPKVSYSWEGLKNIEKGISNDLNRFTAFYRLDYGKVGYALTSDSDTFAPFLFNNAYRQDILTKEIKFDAVKDGETGQYDNIHTVHEDQQVIIPGCGRSNWFGGSVFGMITSGGKIATEYHAFDCVHIHWRWSQSSAPIEVDPMVEPSDDKSIGVSGRGKPNLVPGQTIQIGIVKVDNNTPRDPDDPLSLIKEPKTIATTYDFTTSPTTSKLAALLGGTGATFSARPEKTLKSLTDETGNPVSTIVWYVASGNAQDDPRRSQKDTFFRHGIFVIDPKTTKAELETVRSNLQGLAMLGNEDKKTAVLAQMDSILGSNIWSVDGNMLAGENGGTVFTALSAAASSLLEVRNKAPQLSERMAISQELGEILSATQHMVNSDLQSRLANTLASAPSQQAMFQKVIAENQAIAQSMEKFASTSNGSDLAEAAQIIDGFKQSWFDGVKGISEVATALGISAPTASGVDATPNTAATPTGERTIENGFLTYDNSEYGFSIKYPTTWTKNEIPEGVNFVGASEVFNVWSFKNLPLLENEKKTLDENVKATIDERMKTQSNFRLEESNDIEFNGLPAHKILFTYTDSKSGPTRATEVILINGNVQYELYFAASTELFAKSLPTAEQMFHSFELVGAGSQSTPTGTTVNTPTPVDNNKATTTTGTGQQKQQSAKDTSNGDQLSPGQDQSPPQQPAKSHIADMVDYENQDFRLVMKYPSNWAILESADNVAFTSPAESTDAYLESLYVYHQGDIPLFQSDDETLKKNIEAEIDFRKSSSNFELISSDIIKFNDKNAGKIEYTYTDPNIGNAKALEIIAVDGTDKYSILFIANAEQYSSTLPSAQDIIDSIQITPPL